MTNEKPTYRELLLDPRWQRKRLQIFERDLWECTVCEDSTSTLHLHHKVYRKGLKPWEAPDNELTTVCENCHSAYGEQEERLKNLIAKMHFRDIEMVIGWASALHGHVTGEENITVNGPDDAAGIGAFFDLDFRDVLELSTGCGVSPSALEKLKGSQKS